MNVDEDGARHYTLLMAKRSISQEECTSVCSPGDSTQVGREKDSS
jgi:hypothetical protein